MVLISVTLVIALMISYNLTSKYVENEFASKKIDVLDETIKPYNDFFLNKIPEITLYQGYLTAASAANYSTSVFHAYHFVKKVSFYEIAIGSKPVQVKDGNNLDIAIKSVYEYRIRNGEVVGTPRTNDIYNEDFRDMATKLND